MNDLKIFFKYFFSTFNPSKAIRKPLTWRFITLGFMLYLIFFKDYSLNIKMFIAGVCILIVAFLEIVALYQSGLHRYWYKKKNNILTKGEIKKLKQEVKMNETEQEQLQEDEAKETNEDQEVETPEED